MDPDYDGYLNYDLTKNYWVWADAVKPLGAGYIAAQARGYIK